jgi:hypothetical protein
MRRAVVTLCEHDQPHEAHLLLSALKAAGIVAWLVDELAVRLGEPPVRVKVQVRGEDESLARRVLGAWPDRA